MINEKIDYVITKAKPIEWQKWLNQWEHTYAKIEIINSIIHLDGDITIILKRIKP